MPEGIDVVISTKANLSAMDKFKNALSGLTDDMKKTQKASKEYMDGLSKLNAVKSQAIGIVMTLKDTVDDLAKAYQFLKVQWDIWNSLKQEAKETAAANRMTSDSIKAFREQLDRLNASGIDTTSIQKELNQALIDGNLGFEKRQKILQAILKSDSPAIDKTFLMAERERLQIQQRFLEIQRKSREGEAVSPEDKIASLKLELELVNKRQQLTSDALFTYQAITEDEANKLGNEDLSSRVSILSQIAEIEREAFGATFQGRFRENMRALTTGFENWSVSAANAVTGGIGAALAGIDSAVVGLIQGTVTWGQAFLQVGNMIVSELARVAVRAIVVRAILAPLGLASFAVPGFASGGLIPGAPSSSDNRLAMVATGEYIARSAAVQYYGAGVFEALNSMQIPRDMLASFNMPTRQTPKSSFATGGFVGSGGGINVSPAPVTVVVVNDQKQALNALKTYSGRKVLYQLNTGLKTDLGIT